jgi:hypothetical protein
MVQANSIINSYPLENLILTSSLCVWINSKQVNSTLPATRPNFFKMP